MLRKQKITALCDTIFYCTYVGNLIITVADEPSSPPTLQSNKMKYSAGDLINVSCVTQESYPAVNISWSLNNQTVSFRLLPPDHPSPQHGHTTITGDFNPIPFPDSRLKIRDYAIDVIDVDFQRRSTSITSISSQIDVSNSAVAFGNRTGEEGGGGKSEKTDTKNVYKSNRNAFKISQNGNEHDP